MRWCTGSVWGGVQDQCEVVYRVSVGWRTGQCGVAYRSVWGGVQVSVRWCTGSV